MKNHPYSRFEGTRIWGTVERALEELVENQDLEETTDRRYIVGYLVQELAKAGLGGLNSPENAHRNPRKNRALKPEQQALLREVIERRQPSRAYQAMTPQELHSAAKELADQGASDEDIILRLHELGASILDSIKVVRSVRRISLGGAKQIVTSHPVWAKAVTEAQILQDEAEAVLMMERTIAPLITAHFVISGRDFDPAVCTEALGLTPTGIWTQRHEHLKSRVDLPNVEWHLGFDKKPSYSIDESVAEIVSLIWPARERIRELLSSSGLSASLSCSVTIYEDRPEYCLSTDIMSKLGSLGCKLRLDIFDYSDSMPSPDDVGQEAIGQELDSLMEQQKFSELLNLLRRVEMHRDLTPVELVERGRCVQLAPDEGEWSLKEAEEAFKKALQIDPDYISALTEIGFFYYAIEDNSAQALPFFQRAVEISRLQLTEAAMGMAGCLEELQSQDAAGGFLSDLHCGALVEEKLDEEKREWLQQGLEAKKP